MSEKTAEEKLREELEGRLPEAPHEKTAVVSEPVRKPVKPRAMRSRAAGSKIEKLVNVGQRVDSFMEDFERRIAESLNAENVFSAGRSGNARRTAEESSAELGLEKTGNSEPEKRAAVKTAKRRRRQSEDAAQAAKPEKIERDILGLAAIAEAPEVKQESNTTVELENVTETVQPVSEPEALPEKAQPVPEPEAIPEAVQPIPDTDIDSDSLSDSLDDDSSNDIPVEIIDESDQEIDDEFPDIPVIDAQEIAESSNNHEENTFPDIPVISSESEELDDDFADFMNFDDNIQESSEEPEGTAPAPENHSDFPPFADVVVNIDADLPQISSENQENSSDENSTEAHDPESTAAPVIVAMPESTKTAEDKLMANIAEAMTGSPLTLDKPDPSEPYRLPENLLNPQNDPDFSPQSAEEKLIADISQAISESPIETAQNQANQNFEEDISPFDEMPLPEPIQTPDFDDNYEQNDDANENEEEGDDFDEPFLPDFSAETEQHEQQPQENTLLAEDFDPFSIPDDEDSSADTKPAEDEYTEDFSELTVAEDDTAIEDDMPDFSELPDISLLNEPENDSDTVDLEETSEAESEIESYPEIETPPEAEPEPEPESDPDSDPESQPTTAEQRLVQELADFQNQDISIDPEPEQPMLDEPDTPQTAEDDSGEDFNFMSSWGDAASTMNYGDDEPDSQEQIPETQDTFSQAAQPVTPAEPTSRITHEPLNIHKPQTSQERFELPHSEVQNAALSPVGRIVLQAVLGLLILAGLFSLFRLHSLTDSITSMMLYGNTPVTSAQAYDYAVDLIPDEEISSRMRLRGIEGWKIVGSRRTQDTTTGRYGYEFIFMRQKPSNH